MSSGKRYTPEAYTLLQRNPFDIHVYYNSEAEKIRSLTLRSELQAKFPFLVFHEPHSRPIGPHPVPMWEADFGKYDNAPQWENVVSYLESRHTQDALSILVHPHTTDGHVMDHTAHAFWLGPQLPLAL
eukprot:PhF_6_TR40351/c0_g1_i1/m.60033/K10253/K10253; DOPA 4,5-dioxygenase